MAYLRRTKEKKSDVISKFNLSTTKNSTTKKVNIVVVDGIPHKIKNGVLTPLTKKEKE